MAAIRPLAVFWALPVMAAISGCLTDLTMSQEDLPEPTHSSYALGPHDLGPGSESVVVRLLIVRPMNVTIEYVQRAHGDDSCGSLGYEMSGLPLVQSRSGRSWVESSGLRPSVSTEHGGEIKSEKPVLEGLGTGSSQGSEGTYASLPGQRLTLQLSLPRTDGTDQEASLRVSGPAGNEAPFMVVESVERIPFACGTLHDFSGTYATAGGGHPTVARSAEHHLVTHEATTAWLVARLSTPFSPDLASRCTVSIDVDGRRVAEDGPDGFVCNSAYRGGGGDVTFRIDAMEGRAPHVAYFLWDGDVQTYCAFLDLFGLERIPCMPDGP